MPAGMSEGEAQPSQIPAALVGCLLDVSGSMYNALDTGKGDGRVTDRLRAVLRAALKLARAEHQQNPTALMFVGIFGLKDKRVSVVDLCSLVDAFLGSIEGDGRQLTGHESLVALANQNKVPHISRYITTRLTDQDARIVSVYLQRNESEIQDFVNAIPSAAQMVVVEGANELLGALGGAIGDAVGGATGSAATKKFVMEHFEEKVVDSSIAMTLARRICDEWLKDFHNLIPRRIEEVMSLLERVQDLSSLDNGAKGPTLLDQLRPYLYGETPMCAALAMAQEIFRGTSDIEQRVLVIVSDGNSTDGPPLHLAKELKKDRVTIAAVFLTANASIPLRQLYDESHAHSLSSGQITLLNIATRISVTQHPLPVLASMGWRVPSSGECGLYTSVCSSDALEEFCSILLSARFGSADALLDILGRVDLDAYINDRHIQTWNNPSDQGQTGTCYAHAAAGILHMALTRIVDREGGCPSIPQIRERILIEFPAGPEGQVAEEVLNTAITWYRPLRMRKVNVADARQAILHRRPVLATFLLSKRGWKKFSNHFQDPETRHSTLKASQMTSTRPWRDGGGHAVVLVKCDANSLTFLNSWGADWGSNGSFSIESPEVLEQRGAPDWTRMCFYDIYWIERDLTIAERLAYDRKVDDAFHAQASKFPSVLELEVQCPLCRKNSPIAHITGNIRLAICPSCGKSFKPEPGHLVQALYAKAGLGDVV